MSDQLRNLSIDAFRSAVTPAFQSGSRFRDTVMEFSGVEAETQRFPVIGVSDVSGRASGQHITPANTGNAKPRATLEPLEWYDRVDHQDNAITNVDWMRNLGMVGGKAVGRKIDGLILAAAASWNTGANDAYLRPGLTQGEMREDTGGAATFTAAHLAKGVGKLYDAADDENLDLTLALPASIFEVWAAQDDFKSFDFLQQGAGKANLTAEGKAAFAKVYGAKPIFVGQAARADGKGKLPANRAYLWDRNCIGLAMGTVSTMGSVEWSVETRSWVVSAEANGGAVKTNHSGVFTFRLQ